MGYLNEDGLARYDGLIKNWVTFKSGTVDGIDPLLNWQKTSTAGAVTFSPLPAAPIDPVINFLFTEIGPASGTKGPDNPSTISGVTQAKVTRCGKNLINSFASTSYTKNGIAWTVNSDGTITADGTATDTSIFYLLGPSKLATGLSYTLSGCPSGGSGSTYRTAISHGTYSYETGSGVTFVAGSSPTTISCRVESGVTVSNIVFRPQLELGSTATAFEPYSGADYIIDLGGTFYGGSVDLSTGTMMVTWAGIIYTGEENITSETGSDGYYQYGLPAPSYSANFLACSCTHLVTGGNVGDRFYVRSSGGAGVRIFVSEFATVDSVKTWLTSQYANGTPVMVVYQLATPYTVQLTPTQIYSLSQLDPYTPRVNTVYSDQTSVQVGYPKSPQATATELTNAIISLGSNL